MAPSALDKLAIYIPRKKAVKNVIERLRKLGEKTDCSINCLMVEAVIQYPDREEK